MRAWPESEVRALGVTTDLVTAGSVLGLSRNTAYRLHAEGRFPVRVLSLGAAVYRVPVAGLLEVLGLTPNSSAAGPASPAVALHQSPAAAKTMRSTG